jgi:hypothetical protein
MLAVAPHLLQAYKVSPRHHPNKLSSAVLKKIASSLLLRSSNGNSIQF